MHWSRWNCLHRRSECGTQEPSDSRTVESLALSDVSRLTLTLTAEIHRTAIIVNQHALAADSQVSSVLIHSTAITFTTLTSSSSLAEMTNYDWIRTRKPLMQWKSIFHHCQHSIQCSRIVRICLHPLMINGLKVLQQIVHKSSLLLNPAVYRDCDSEWASCMWQQQCKCIRASRDNWWHFVRYYKEMQTNRQYQCF